jgi:hypothetical protein
MIEKKDQNDLNESIEFDLIKVKSGFLKKVNS